MVDPVMVQFPHAFILLLLNHFLLGITMPRDHHLVTLSFSLTHIPITVLILFCREPSNCFAIPYALILQGSNSSVSDETFDSLNDEIQQFLFKVSKYLSASIFLSFCMTTNNNIESLIFLLLRCKLDKAR